MSRTRINVVKLVLLGAAFAGWSTPCWGQALSPNQNGTGQAAGTQIRPDQQATAGNAGNARPYQTVPIQAPPGFPLSAKHQEYVDGILQYWEASSSQIQRLKCSFNRWSYDSAVCNYIDPASNQMVAFEIAGGDIQFENPDKAYIAVEKKRLAIPPSANTPELQWRDLDSAAMEQQKERYICNGDAIFMFDFAQQQLIKQILPPEARGEGIKHTPMPFLFGAKAAELKERYWIRPLQTPDGVEKQWYLEVYPKKVQDAEHYSVARIVLAGDQFLPKSIQLFSPDYNPQKITLADGTTMPAVIKYQVYEFSDHKVNFTLNKLLAPWRDAFNPRTPTGWKLAEKQMASRQAQGTSGGAPR